MEIKRQAIVSALWSTFFSTFVLAGCAAKSSPIPDWEVAHPGLTVGIVIPAGALRSGTREFSTRAVDPWLIHLVSIESRPRSIRQSVIVGTITRVTRFGDATHNTIFEYKNASAGITGVSSAANAFVFVPKGTQLIVNAAGGKAHLYKTTRFKITDKNQMLLADATAVRIVRSIPQQWIYEVRVESGAHNGVAGYMLPTSLAIRTASGIGCKCIPLRLH